MKKFLVVRILWGISGSVCHWEFWPGGETACSGIEGVSGKR